MRIIYQLASFFTFFGATALADAPSQPQRAVETGVSGIWILANVSYAGMRAQGNPSTGWRIVAFLFGFPGTLVSTLAIREGSERAYGIDIPKK